MKKLMLALATACAIGFTAVADATDWFNGGVAEGWPTAGEGLAGGAWSNTDGCSWNGTAVTISTESEPESALTFTATDEKNLADTNVTINTQFVFTPYSKGSLPSIPADAKAGIIMVSTNTEDVASAEEDCYFYYVNYNDAAGVQSNEWKKSAITAKTTDNKPITVSISKGEKDGFYKVTYNFQGEVVEASVASTVATVGKVVCVGSGKMSALNASYEVVAASTLTLDNNFSNMSVTNVSVNGTLQGVAASYTVPYNGNVIVYFEPAKDYELDKDTYVINGMKENFTLNSDTEGIPTATAIVYGTLTFNAANDYDVKILTGKVGTAVTDDDKDEVNAWANTFDAQKPHYWFDGKWLDGQPGEGSEVPFPTEYVKDAFYYASITAITYRVGTEAAGNEVNVLIGGGEYSSYTVETIETEGLAGAEVVVSGDPDEDPTGAGRTFSGWTCEFFNITTPTKADDLDTLTMPDSFDSWDDLGDIIFVANWEESEAPVKPGEEKSYDSEEEAKAATNNFVVAAATPAVETLFSDDPTGFATYQAMFEPKITQSGEKYVVTAEFKPTVASDLQTAVNTATKDIEIGTIAAAEGASDIAVSTTVKGLYYQMNTSTEVTDLSPITEKLGTGDAITFEGVAKPGTDKGFYKISVSASPRITN